MQVVFDHDAVGLPTGNWLWNGCYHLPGIKLIIIAARAQQMLDPIERLPNELPNWPWVQGWRSLQGDWLNCAGTG